ncbi:LacI family DNA-binding transcriptional regulator [Pedobacter helvus]|uniref:LacI family DNA-binding transcriptional regulator n=1 Tax=Pedobacter helvus TaxID=2563444 RepID=A0ABW9JPE6_9SPHI|nr:LacI family DNA-binding transcriptional regulator [Pedobacter ureilyticus]
MQLETATIKTIADTIGLSLTTVSRVLNGVAKKYRISKATEERVLAEADRLGYIPNQAARNLRLKKSFAIGLVIPNLANPFFANIVSVVNQVLHERGYSVILTDCNEEEKLEIEAVNALSARNMDGMIVIPSGRGKKHLELLRQKRTPVVFIDRYFEDLAIPYVATNHYDGALKITEYLIANGHRKIACLQGSNHVMPNIKRVQGYIDAMKGHGHDPFYIGGNGFTFESGYLETKLLMQRSERPTAILALSDTILLGSLKALAEDGYRVPEDISIATFDNSVYLDFLACPVTSVSQPVTDIATIAIKLLLDKIEQQSTSGLTEQEKILISPAIIYRSSIASIP